MEERNKKKTYIEELDRGIYDVKNQFSYSFKTEEGLSKEIILEISKKKNEPKWMTDFRLKSLEIYNNMQLPPWGPDLEDLHIENIVAYVRPKTEMKGKWEDVPEDIKDTFDRLGIPKAEQTSLAGVGAQYDSEVVYHSIKEELVKKGVVYTDMETAIRDYEDIVKEYFMALVPPSDHKFAALHGAVWSGGSFVYVPEGVDVDIPLQSYFRLNAPGAGQFEHTLIIVEKGARLRYSTIENWSKNMYNLNTKRAVVEKDGVMEWVSGSFGSKVSMLYPMTILKGERSKVEFTGITFAGKGQHLDTGCKVIHAAPYTTSTVNSKSISKGGGTAIYRGALKVAPNAHNVKASISCESLMLDNISKSDTIPVMDLQNDEIEVGHEAKIGRISDEAIFYLMSRGISEQDARSMIVRGFVEPIAKELPLEYAVEMNNLINLELEGSRG